MKKLIGASLFLMAFAVGPVIAQSPSGPSSSPSGPLGTNVDNVSTSVVGNIITVTISLDAGGSLTVQGSADPTAPGAGGTTTTGGSTLTSAALIAKIEAAVAQLSSSAGAGGGPAILLLNGLLTELKGNG